MRLTPVLKFAPTLFFRLLTAALAALLLVACGDKTQTQTKPDTSYDIDPAAYSGPPPATADVAAFKQYLWNNIAVSNRCGACHGTGGQAPQFARNDDINLAYAAANTVVDLANPEDSRLVERVGSGHNCWSDDNGVCADIMATYIRNWALATVGGPASTVTLVAPPVHVPGASKTFPASSSGYGSTIYPLVREYCAGCHSPDATRPQAPFFAGPDVDAAYLAARNAINLENPGDSRFVQRLANEFHNCWDDCAANATEMIAAITAFADGIALLPVDPALLTSGALTLYEGIVASSGGRNEANVVAKYLFKEGSGAIAHDTSGVSPALDLNFSGDVGWVGGWGIRLNGGKAQASTLASNKLYSLLRASGEYSIEAWIAPANVAQEGPARIVSYSGGDDTRNFLLGQSQYNYDFLNRATGTDGAGMPALSTADAAQRAQATLQHVVVTYSAVNGRRIYVNGVYTGDPDPAPAGTLDSWNNSFALVLGSEVSGTFPWRGVVKFLAIHARALTDAQIAQNFQAGVGERYYLLFDISPLVDHAQVYVLFEGSQFDDYSYLFTAPKLVSLDKDFVPDGIPLAGMRIAVNGREAGVGQAYRRLDLVLDGSTWIPGAGDELSRLGTVIPLENGPQFDQFFLTFEKIGSHVHTVTEAVPPPPADTWGDAQPDVGLRLFDEVNASLAAITSVPETEVAVSDMYERVKEQLPASDAMAGFSSAQQIGITQLAVEYCNALVEDPVMATLYFAGFNIDAPYTSAFASAGQRAQVTGPILLHAMNTGLTSMPDAADVEAELDALIGRLVDSCTGTCAADPVGRTHTILKAVCAAGSANATMLIQ